MRIGRRPNRSPSIPNTSAPSGRMASVSVIATETAFTSVPNSAAMACEHEHHQEEVERVERPAEEAGREGAALASVEQRPLFPDVHARFMEQSAYWTWMYSGTGQSRRMSPRGVGGLSFRNLVNCFQPVNCTGSA